MKLFILENCPHCIRARKWIEELCQEDEKYKAIPLEIIDEAKDVEQANEYDYYYVPTFYDGHNKVHEGVASKEKIKKIFDNYLEEKR